MPICPLEVSELLDRLTAQFPKLLGDNLVGIYIYGSLTQAAFDPARSDIDIVVATRRDLDDKQFARVGDWLSKAAAENAWTERLQMLILAKEDIVTMDARACHYQFGKLTRGGSDGNPIPWINILKSGITLYGPPATSFVPEITADMLFETLVREAGYLREELTEKPDGEWRDVPKYRAYAVLTVCRILYSRQKLTLTSKPRAAIWALKNLPDEWHELILAAVDHDAGRAAKLPLGRIRSFVRFAAAELKKPRKTSKSEPEKPRRFRRGLLSS